MFKHRALLAFAILLASCAAPPHRPPASIAPKPAQALPAAGTYRIEPDRSELRVLVYRAGAFANLGHNHVMVNRTLSGTLRVGTTLAASSCEFSLPVSQFTVDEADARREEGQDFATEVAADARAGTLHNMLSAAVLNAADNPTITIHSVAFALVAGALQATLSVRVAGHESIVVAPFEYQGIGTELKASAEFELKQSALGMTPYSLMLGALSVRDAMQIKIKLAASLN
jgi:polyisoprenoid-binding protein YceI